MVALKLVFGLQLVFVFTVLESLLFEHENIKKQIISVDTIDLILILNIDLLLKMKKASPKKETLFISMNLTIIISYFHTVQPLHHAWFTPEVATAPLKVAVLSKKAFCNLASVKLPFDL